MEYPFNSLVSFQVRVVLLRRLVEVLIMVVVVVDSSFIHVSSCSSNAFGNHINNSSSRGSSCVTSSDIRALLNKIQG